MFGSQYFGQSEFASIPGFSGDVSVLLPGVYSEARAGTITAVGDAAFTWGGATFPPRRRIEQVKPFSRGAKLKLPRVTARFKAGRLTVAAARNPTNEQLIKLFLAIEAHDEELTQLTGDMVRLIQCIDKEKII